MAAFDTPWTTSMSSATPSGNGGSHASESASTDFSKPAPTMATFSPNSQTFSSHQHRSTILVHQKSPLLLATPPQVTRALAYSHPFIIPLNRLAGLLSWTSGDPWESFLFVATFWLTTLYGSHVIRYTGPVLLVTFLILGMYFRRYSPLSSTGWTGEKKQKSHRRDPSDTSSINHHKSLDEILATLQTFTTRCNILLDPFLRLTDFLSTQQTATSATTQPALTTLFIRILIASPLWWALALPPEPFRILYTKRITLVFGTIILSWHSRPAKISRSILWRSRTVRQLCTFLTGLDFGPPSSKAPPLPPRLTPSQSAIRLATLGNRDRGQGIRFTFTLFENQRRWLGIGWTASMLAYERHPWTDEHLNPSTPPTSFELPEVEGGLAKWKWVQGSEWRVDTTSRPATKEATLAAKGKNKEKEQETEEEAWVYYDNKWRDGRRGVDGWGRYTRRRKWVRDAELVDIDPEELAREQAAAEDQRRREDEVAASIGNARSRGAFHDDDADTIIGSTDGTIPPSSVSASFSTSSAVSEPGTSPGHKRRSWFTQSKTGRRSRTVSNASGSADGSSVSSSMLSRAAARGDGSAVTPTAILKEREAEWGLGDDVHMELG